MAKIESRPTLSVQIVIVLTEPEARALDALVGYGDDAFIKAFYEKLGEAYMKEHEIGLRSLFASIRQLLPPWLSKADAARKSFNS